MKFLENFEYSIEGNLFKSNGSIKFKDKGIIITNFLKYISIRKKEIVGTTQNLLNDESFKINKKIIREYLLIQLVLKKMKVCLIKVYLLCANTEKMISARHGQFSQKK